MFKSLLLPKISCLPPQSVVPLGGHGPKNQCFEESSCGFVTGTIFGNKNGGVGFCLQEHPRAPPLMALQFSMPTWLLAKEMQCTVLRIALVCHENKPNSCSLFSVPIWKAYCNGRWVGFAIRQHDIKVDSILRLLQSSSAGVGVIPAEETKVNDGEEVMYMRATFKRVRGLPDSESFHMIDPHGTTGQELSIFLLREI